MSTQRLLKILLSKGSAVFLVLALSGCETVKVVAEPKAFDAQCNPECEIACEPLAKWDGTREHGDRLLESDGTNYKICATRQAFCVACILTLRAAGVIR